MKTLELRADQLYSALTKRLSRFPNVSWLEGSFHMTWSIRSPAFDAPCTCTLWVHQHAYEFCVIGHVFGRDVYRTFDVFTDADSIVAEMVESMLIS
ncbi:MAG: hypothetical protein EOP04_23410 [Proteobacteria bacterium]|nr:MAG: hypothetical protein EOP04_23410 [Pseudomonadota bacterium]